MVWTWQKGGLAQRAELLCQPALHPVLFLLTKTLDNTWYINLDLGPK